MDETKQASKQTNKQTNKQKSNNQEVGSKKKEGERERDNRSGEWRSNVYARTIDTVFDNKFDNSSVVKWRRARGVMAIENRAREK